MMSPSARLAAGVIAIAFVAALIGRLFVTMDIHETGPAGAVWHIYRFFTVWTNTLTGVLCAVIALGGHVRAPLQAGLALWIGMVGMLFHLLLAQFVNYQGLQWVLDQMFHTVIPASYVLFWIVFSPKTGVMLRHVPLWVAYPLGYCIYAICRGLIDGAYPYPFLDLATLGWNALAVNVVGLLVVFAVLGAIIVGAAKRLDRPRQAA